MGDGGAPTRRALAGDGRVTDGPAVGIDVSAIPVDPRGAGRYVIELVGALHRRRNIELHLQTRRADAARWRALAPGADVRAVVPDATAKRMVWEQTAGVRFVGRWGIDVHHGPHYTMPEAAQVPKVVTVHDLTFFDHPEWHERAKVPVFRRAIRVAARHASAIVCVSAPTARRLQELLDPQCPVHVVEHGIDHDLFRPAEPTADPDADADVLAALGIRAPYLAFLGTLEPRKDVATLVLAFDRVATANPTLQLVVAGGAGWGNDRFEEAVASSPHRNRILRTGYVEQPLVPVLLRGAAAVIYPAIEEGFGLPALEALACGAALVTTTGSVMEEVAGGAANVAVAGDVAGMARHIERLLHDGPSASQRALGLDVASRFTWEATAAGHEAVYASVAGSRSASVGFAPT